MVKAYIFLTLAMGDTKPVFKELKQIENIESIAVVAGVYDVILRVNVKDLEELYELTYVDISKIAGIKETTTFVVEKEIKPEED